MKIRALTIAAVAPSATAALCVFKRSAFSYPSPGHPGRWLTWWSSTNPVVAIFSLLRLVAICLGGYLSLLLLVALGAGLLAEPSAARVLAVTRLWGARSALTVVLGSSIAASLVAGCAASSSGPRGAAGIPSHQVASAATPALAAPVLRYVGPLIAVPPARHVARPASSPRAAPASSERSPPVDTARRTWTVRPGDSLWSIAASALSEEVGRPVSDTEIGHYWVRLVDLNRPNLAVPSDPDLIFSGNSIALPPVDAADLGGVGS